jgi:hypothetical protein
VLVSLSPASRGAMQVRGDPALRRRVTGGLEVVEGYVTLLTGTITGSKYSDADMLFMVINQRSFYFNKSNAWVTIPSTEGRHLGLTSN